MKNLLFIVFLFISITFTYAQKNQSNWVAPDKYKSLKAINNNSDIKYGKNLYSKYCKSCHGTNGDGSGVKAASLKTYAGDFSDKKLQSKTDGELYFISIIGYNEMPNFEKKLITDEDRWSIVSYIRTFKK